MNKIILTLLIVTIYFGNELFNGKAMCMHQQATTKPKNHQTAQINNNGLESISAFLEKVHRKIKLQNEELVNNKYLPFLANVKNYYPWGKRRGRVHVFASSLHLHSRLASNRNFSRTRTSNSNICSQSNSNKNLELFELERRTRVRRKSAP